MKQNQYIRRLKSKRTLEDVQLYGVQGYNNNDNGWSHNHKKGMYFFKSSKISIMNLFYLRFSVWSWNFGENDYFNQWCVNVKMVSTRESVSE